MKKQTTAQHEKRVKALLANGEIVVIIKDNDDEAWGSGWSFFLSDTFKYDNFGSGFRAYIDSPRLTPIQRVKAAAESIKLQTEERPEQSLLGICLGKGVWHWLHHVDGFFISVYQSYSQNTGRTFKGVMHGIRARIAITNRTGVEI